jgi:uncharacterized lipoprotein YajG
VSKIKLFALVAVLMFCAGFIGCDTQQTQQIQSAPVAAPVRSPIVPRVYGLSVLVLTTDSARHHAQIERHGVLRSRRGRGRDCKPQDSNHDSRQLAMQLKQLP